MANITISAAILNIAFMQGSRVDDAVLSILWKSGDPAEPIDLTGWSARAQFRAQIRSPIPVFDLSSEDGSIRLNDPIGSIVLVIDETKSSAAIVYSGVYDLEMTDPDGKITRLVQGKWTMSREVTRDE